MLRILCRGAQHLQCRTFNAAAFQLVSLVRHLHRTPESLYNYHQFSPKPNKKWATQSRFSVHEDIKLQPVNWGEVELSPCVRKQYTPHPNVLNLTPEEVETFRQEHQIKIRGADVNPILSFKEANFDGFIAKNLEKKRWDKPTPIQAQSWPIVMSNQNMVGVCHTGSGKTLCYALPALEHIKKQRQNGTQCFDPQLFTYTPIALVLVPTRELARQVLNVVQEFSPNFVTSVAVYGGVKDTWYYKLSNSGMDLCIATPGRLIACLSSGKISLKNCTYLVVDEADNMLDMGFKESIDSIMGQVRPDRQLLMWTATWSSDIKDLAKTYLKEHTLVHIGTSDQTPNQNIKQNIEVCNEEDKSTRVTEIISSIRMADKKGKIIIFANTIKRVEYIRMLVARLGVSFFMISGPMSQERRNSMVDGFARTPGAVLIATDVASRGLDLDGVDYIINYDFPPVLKTYVHRIGRCGRKNIQGTSYTFLTAEDERHVNDLVSLLKESKQEVNPAIFELTSRGMSRRYRMR